MADLRLDLDTNYQKCQNEKENIKLKSLTYQLIKKTELKPIYRMKFLSIHLKLEYICKRPYIVVCL